MKIPLESTLIGLRYLRQKSSSTLEKLLQSTFLDKASKIKNTTQELNKQKSNEKGSVAGCTPLTINPIYVDAEAGSKSQIEVLTEKNKKDKQPPPVAPRSLASLLNSALKDYAKDPVKAREKWIPDNKSPK